jgi:tetratricopeptide (TPR) repeat protein
MSSTSGARPTLEEAILAALADGDDPAAAALLRVAFGGETAGVEDLPELLEELAEYFVSVNRPEDALTAASKAIMLTPSGADAQALLKRRCRVAEGMLAAGLAEEATAVYAAVAQEAPGQTWVHEAAGSDYVEAGEHEMAYAWLTAGLELAVAQRDPDCAERLSTLRRISMTALGRSPDSLDRQAAALIGGEPAADTGPATDADEDDLALITELEADGDQDTLRLVQTLRRISAS